MIVGPTFKGVADAKDRGFVEGAAEDIQVSFDGQLTFDNRDDFRDYAKSYYDWTSNPKNRSRIVELPTTSIS